MENFDIFNLDNEAFVKQEVKKEEDEFIYKPYPELGKDGVYKSLIRFLPNVTNPKKSKVHQYYVWLKDPVDGTNMKALCPSTVGKKSVLKDLFLKNHVNDVFNLSIGFLTNIKFFISFFL